MGRRELGQRVSTFLGEFRMIIPALGALLGFQLTLTFQQTFGELPPSVKLVNFGGVACSAAALLALLVPASAHRFMAGAQPTERFLTLARRSVEVAFVLLPLGLAACLYVQAVRTFGAGAMAVAVGVGALAAFALAWWLVPWFLVAHDPDVKAEP